MEKTPRRIGVVVVENHARAKRAMRSRPVKGRAVCIGVFDGVHRGHQRIIRETLRVARRLRLEPMALTFDPHPSAVVCPRKRVKLIYGLGHRLLHLAQAGIQLRAVLVFDRKMARMSALGFIREVLIRKLKAHTVLIGEGFRFGRGGEGDAALLRSQLPGVRVVGKLKSGACAISSTRIRGLISAGRLAEAGRLCGRPVGIYGQVVRGHGRGRKLGFPTINIRPVAETLPPAGIYAGRFIDPEAGPLNAVIHLGPRPTFGEKIPSFEIHVIHRAKMSVPRYVEVQLIKRLREVRRYSTSEALIVQMNRDVRSALSALRHRKK
ncbi:MAG: riboflavin biosynthesis protein RibF [Candidatus Omnitrophica bacterium]|nr:riboflavin biosynthesis protein RibF [Candidatus Omnitrophota bacterium]